jgi:hypothetical protein
LILGRLYDRIGISAVIVAVATGLLYEHSRLALIVFSVVVQLTSIPLFALASRVGPKHHPQRVDPLGFCT